MILESDNVPNHNRVAKRMTEPLGLRQNIRFGDEIASKVDLAEEAKDNAHNRNSSKETVGKCLNTGKNQD